MPTELKRHSIGFGCLLFLLLLLAGCGSHPVSPPPVTLVTPNITWATPASVTYGTALSGTQLNATASAPGTFAYSPAIGVVPVAGSVTLNVTFTPLDTKTYTTATASVVLVVAKAVPVIAWTNPLAVLTGTALSSAQLNATASVAGSFIYSPAAGYRAVLGPNTLTASFTPTDTANYKTASATVNLNASEIPNPAVTNIEIKSNVLRTGMNRLGMNIDSQNFYDSGQMLRNLTFRNPGFEGESWQSILHCVVASATTCTDGNPYAQWPANFLQGATFEFIYGAALGQTGTVVSSTAANQGSNTGVTLTLSSMTTSPAAGDFVVVRMQTPGNAQAGWWPSVSGGATVSTEFTDLSPATIGKQALRMTAAGTGQSASLDSYFDSTNMRNYVLLNGVYVVTFRAKGVGGNNQMVVSAGRQIASGNYFSQTLTLGPAWQDYILPFTAAETASTGVGTVDLHFGISGASVLLDDVALRPAVSSVANPTVFRDDVVSTLKELHPGTLRYMDGLPDFGSSIDNMLTPAFGRVRAGSSTQQSTQEDIAIGLHEFLQLCQTVGADPWYVLPPGISLAEMQNLIEYLGGSPATVYGAKRVALGQAVPWTSVFTTIHLELGNEEWNAGTFPGNSMNDPVAYGNRVAAVFGAARRSASYNAANYDLVMGSFAANPWYTGQEIANSSNYDTVAVAPYLFTTLNDTSSNEAIFGPMFAEPEMADSLVTGVMAQQALAVALGGKKFAIYEENLSTLNGTATQSMVNAIVPSVGGGIAMADHMLLQMRDLGITTQNVWALPGASNQFNNPSGASETSPLFGTVIDMGGQTNLRRPVFLATQLINTAVQPNMLGVTVTGGNPTWNQLLSANDSVLLSGAHALQAFAFFDGVSQRSLVLVNLARTATLPVTFSGANAPTGSVAIDVLTSANITDSNESAANVKIAHSSVPSFQGSSTYSVPPFSLTVFTWNKNP